VKPGADAQKKFWAELLNSIPLLIRRRASYYLGNIKKISLQEWVVWSSSGAQYNVRVEDEGITCTCPYFQERKGYCKHIASVCVHELIRLDFMRKEG